LLAYTVVRFFFGGQWGMLLLTATLITLLEIEYVRLEYRLKLPKPINVLRGHEKDNVTSAIYFVISTIICFAAFDYQIAVMALVMTIFGDMMSALIGMRFGRTKIHKKKTLEGFGAGFLTNLLVGMLMLPGQFLVLALMVLTASLVELFTGKLDDNLTVPLAAGFIGQGLVVFFGLQITTFPGPTLSWIISNLGVFGL